MKLFTAIQGVALLSAVGMSVGDHSLAVGITLFIAIQVLYGIPSITIFVMRRVRNYNRRLAGMEAYRVAQFTQQYGTNPRTQPTYRKPANQVYTLR